MTRGAQTWTLTPTRRNPDPACGLQVTQVTREISRVGHRIDRKAVHNEMHTQNDIEFYILPQPVDPRHGSGLYEG